MFVTFVLCVSMKMRLVKMRYSLRKPLWLDLISIFTISSSDLKPQTDSTQDEESWNLLSSIS